MPYAKTDDRVKIYYLATCIDRLNSFAPNLRAAIVGAVAITPNDLGLKRWWAKRKRRAR